MCQVQNNDVTGATPKTRVGQLRNPHQIVRFNIKWAMKLTVLRKLCGS
jgi:hypothetical protein